MFHVPAHKSASAGSASNFPYPPGEYAFIDGEYTPVFRIRPVCSSWLSLGLCATDFIEDMLRWGYIPEHHRQHAAEFIRARDALTIG